MLSDDKKREDFFNVCSKCEMNCCRDARPPITQKRKEIIEAYLRKQRIPIRNPFVQKGYTFPKEDKDGYCIFYDKNSSRCTVHPVKPETCAAGPITFDINKKTRKIEWYLKTEDICPLAKLLLKDEEKFEGYFVLAKKEIFRLIRNLDSEALRAILRREEPYTYKIGEEDVERNVLSKT